MQYSSLIEILKDKKNSANTGITFIRGSCTEDFLSYQELYHSAMRALSFLQHRGIEPKDELVLQIEDNRSFLTVFWACILGGIIPVPLTFGRNDDHRQKLFNIWSILNNPYTIISRNNFNKLKSFAEQNGLKDLYFKIKDRVVDERDVLSSVDEGKGFEAKEDDIAFIQFSSGSTGNPKGVILTHKNLIRNVGAITKVSSYSTADSMMSWMPLTHDMGLIGFHINPLFCGMNQYLIETNLFIRRPALWLAKASEHKVSILCSPNFGYQYFLKHFNASEGFSWDLSPIRIFYNGAEPISQKLCSDFLTRLATYGLKSSSMCPVYGLAEASLAVSISGMDDEVISMNLDRNKLNIGDEVRISDQDAISCVNVGKPIPHCSIRITDVDDAPVSDGIIGHVQVKGDNVTRGYYNDEHGTTNVFTETGWLRTGDLGFIKSGALYITGRAKDIFFINGQNYFPHDIERVATEIDGVELNKIVITGFYNVQTDKEEVIAFVFHRAKIERFIPILKSLERVINLKFGITVDRVIPVKDIPRTTSGKLQRFKLLEQYKSGSFKEVESELNRIIAESEVQTDLVTMPVNQAEQKLLEIWKKVLNNNTIDVTQRFFEIGGNSLKASEIAMMVLKEFQVDLPLKIIYEKQTVKELADQIESRIRVNYTPIPSIRKNDYYPLSPSQKRLYYFWELDKSSVAYNIPTAFEITGEIEIKRLEYSIRQIIERHDSLRMSFHLRSGQPKFKVRDHIDFTLNFVTCTTVELDEKLRGLVQPFDLTTDPLFRITLLKGDSVRNILFVDFHHAISDGLSIYNFVDELLRLYHDEKLTMLSVQYRDFVYWERDYSGSEKVKAHEEYWLKKLEGELPVLRIPLDFQRPMILSSEGQKIELGLSKEVTAQLRSIAQAKGCTLHVLLFAVYNILLSKYSGQEDIVIGIPVAARRHPDIQKLHGMFVNNLPIRSSINYNESFGAFLETERRNVTESLANQDYPFEKLLEKINQKRDVSRNPVFDSMFIFQNMGLPRLEHGDFTLSRYFFDPGFSKFDISMEVYEEEEALKYQIEYSTKLFKRDTILRIARHFAILIKSIISDLNSKISDLLLIDQDEYNAYINNFNSTKYFYPEDKKIHQLFEQQAKNSPENIAIQYDGAHDTYSQLNNKANNLAIILRRKGVTQNSIVAILLPRSPELIAGLLGVLKAGGCYLLIDEGLPRERIDYLIFNSQCKLVITGNRSVRGLQLAPEIECINIDSLDLIKPAPYEVDNVGSPSDLAYIVYTSGTTGEPKGVMIEHKSLVNYSWWAAKNYIKDEKVAFPLYTSISFDLTITSIFAPLISGNKIVIYDEAHSEMLIEKIIADNKVDIIKLTPSHLKILSESELFRLAANTKIRRFIVGGEQLESRLARHIYTLFQGNVEIFNEYGPTEATVGCMIHRFDPEESGSSVPIGIPIGNTQVYLVDKFLKPVPVGVSGELYISGDGIARGYLFNEEITTRKFIPNPFAHGQRMYTTGDIAIRLSNGTIEYIGRSDQQVKINGYRIELSEIERHLLAHNSVAEALITVRANGNGQRNLYAYYKSKDVIQEAALRSFLANRLPHYMIPVRFIWLERVPLTKNGKVDFDALPEPKSNKETYVNISSKSDIEELSLNVWKEVLGVNEICLSDNFFELGGDSIKAVQIASRLFEKGISVSAKDILTYHTIEQVSLRAELIDMNSSYEQGVVEGEMQLKPIDTWFFSHKFENPNYYNQSVLLLLNKKVNIELLSAAFAKVIEHHDGLRINFNPEKNVLFYNNRHLEKTFVLEEFEISGDDQSFSKLIGICQDIRTKFEITSSLLLKAAIIKEEKSTELLFISAHHLVMDGVSWRILLEDLKTIYNALENGETAELPLKTASLIDWERGLIEYSESEDLSIEEEYWRQVEDAEFAIPQDFEIDKWKVEHLDKISGSLDKQKTDFLLREAHNTYKTDVFILLNTALALTLKEWTGTDKIVIEQESHGRQLGSVDASRTLGWFTAMYPLILELKNDSISDQIKAIKEQIRKVPHRGIGYSIGRYIGKLSRNKNNKLTDVRLNYLGQFDREFNNELFSFSDRQLGEDADRNNTMTAKLELNLMVISGKLNLDISFNRVAHKASTIRWFKDVFFKNLERILEHIRNEDDVHFTPSDFDSVGLDDEELHALFQ